MQSNIKTNIFKGLLLAILGCAVLWTPAIKADTLSINLGYWPGELDPEMEERLFLDDLLLGGNQDFNPGRLDLEWTNKQTNTVYPLGLEFRTLIGKGDLVLRGNYSQYNPEYKFNAITTGGAVTIASLNEYGIYDTEFDAGYRFHLLGNTLFVTPLVGYRTYKKSFFQDELTISSSGFGKTLDSDFEASTSGLFTGVEFQYYFTKEFSLVGSYVLSSNAWSGTATQNKITAFVNNNGSSSFTYEAANSNYQLRIDRWHLGLQYDVDKNFHLQVGAREEKLTQSYPGYINLAFDNINGFGGIAGNEILSDYIIYEQKIAQTKGLVYVAMSYDIDL